MPLRATEHDEAVGMDIVYHGEEAYVTACRNRRSARGRDRPAERLIDTKTPRRFAGPDRTDERSYRISRSRSFAARSPLRIAPSIPW